MERSQDLTAAILVIQKDGRHELFSCVNTFVAITLHVCWHVSEHLLLRMKRARLMMVLVRFF